MSRCDLCPARYNCVPAFGPEDAEVVLLGEAPGSDEDKHKIPFVGKTGQEVNEGHLPAANLRRSNVYIDNVISCWPDTPQHKLKKDNTAHIDLLNSCANHHLYPYLMKAKPRIIVAMGAFACYALDPEIDLELHHGIPMQTDWGTVFPMWHPAGGLHEPKKMLQIRTDWVRLGEYLKGRLHLPEDIYADKEDYRECNGYKDVLSQLDPTLPLAMDTEYSRSIGAFCTTFSQYPGTGRLIKASSLDQLEGLQHQLDRWESYIYWHNWLYDWKVVEEMNLSFPIKWIRDTMNMAFSLGNIPAGLKALCYRELGMEMEDYLDLVTPYSYPHVIDYYRKAYVLDWPKPEPINYIGKNGEPKIKRPHSIKTKLKGFFTAAAKSQDRDPFVQWNKNWVEHQLDIEEKCGPWPGMDLVHVPFDKMLHYACRDADGVIRLVPVLEEMIKKAESGLPQERWRREA